MTLPSAEYWARRSEERLIMIERGTNKYLGRMLRDNRRAVRLIRKDIEETIGHFVGNSGLSSSEALDLLNAPISDAERSRLIELCKSVDNVPARAQLMAKVNAPAYKARIDRLQAIELSAQARLAKIAPQHIRTTTSGLREAGREAYLRTMFDLQRGTGVGFVFGMVTDAELSATLRLPWSGKHYSQRIWGNVGRLAATVRETVAQNLISGRSWRRSMDDFEEQLLLDSQHAVSRLLRTETAYVANEMTAEAYSEAGLEQYRFVATLDTRTSEICQSLDGKRFPIKERKPGVNYPPMHPHCRSTTIAVIDGQDLRELQRRARNPETGEGELVPAEVKYSEWRKQTLMRQYGEAAKIPESMEGNFDDFEPLTITAEERDDFRALHAKSKNDGLEHGIIIRADGTKRERAGSEADRVRMGVEEADGAGLKLYHSHTNDTPLSANDLRWLCNPNVAVVGNVTNNGDIFRAYVGSGWIPDVDEFNDALRALRLEADDVILGLPDFFDWSIGERNYMAIREQAYLICRNFEWTIEGGKM